MIEAAQDPAAPAATAAPGALAEPYSASGHSCAVKLPIFEGPLDLLLHLIRANEVDVTDIPIALISEQYLEYLEMMRTLDIDIAGEYLLMAATLAHIKSRMLLPPDPDAIDDEVLDPRAELARRLAEFAAYREVAAELGERPLLGRDVFEGQSDLSELPARREVLTVSLFALIDAMQRVLEGIPAEARHHQVEMEHITLKDRMVRVMDGLRENESESILFEDLLADGATHRQIVVVTFLSILELAKIQALLIFQNVGEDGRPVGPIRVRLAVTGGPQDDQILAAAVRAEAEMAGDAPDPNTADPAIERASAADAEGDDESTTDDPANGGE